MTGPPEHVERNRTYWDGRAGDHVVEGRRRWERDEPVWGIFSVPESRVGLLPRELEGREAIELGCGTGYVSAWLARRGAHPVGIDNSERQLATARELQAEFDLQFPLLHGDAEHVPYPDASFDVAISEYGASIWCDPYAWIPEAARLLRPGGELVFLVNSVLSILCGPDDENEPAGDRLLRPLFGMHRVEWPGDPSVEFHLPQGKMIELLSGCDLQVEQLIEVRPPADALTRFSHIALGWARDYPCEEVWRARKRGARS
ncbi:MAG TPA: class I SAM-dependent methyltransferase [Solirubrobacterales bacterium]|nr:class I SAM-dependent methyltransferase [Solirubrobacterales bacterium]